MSNILIWKDNTPQKQIDAAAEMAFAEIMQSRRSNFPIVPMFTRIIGQSGSGKTTQVLPALLEHDKTSAVIAVRDFVKYYPIRNVPREVINGFCLRVLTAVLYKLIDIRADIILDMTLLTLQYEKILLRRLQLLKYRFRYLILAVPKKQSDAFIKAREAETGRAVTKKSANFFYKHLISSLRYLSEQSPDAECVIWSAYELNPVYCGHLGGCMSTFAKTRHRLCGLKYTKQQLLQAKIDVIRVHIFPHIN